MRNSETEPIEVHVLDRRVRLLQPATGFRTSLDSVMLAAACPARGSERILDLGCGVGGAAFCLQTRVPDTSIVGIDIQAEYIDLAIKNAALNKKTDRFEFIAGDVLAPEKIRFDELFDHVICNPPYLEAGAHTPSPDQGKATALGHGPDGGAVADWITFAFHSLKSGGSLTLIHRADMLDKIIQGLAGRAGGRRFGAVEIIPLWPRAGDAARRVIVRARKDRQTPATLHAGIVLHESDGSYTAETESILRGGAAIYS